MDLDTLTFDCAAGILSLQGSVWEEVLLPDALDATHVRLSQTSRAVMAEAEVPPIHLGEGARWARLDITVPISACSLCGTEVVVRLTFSTPLGEMAGISLPVVLACGP